MPTVDVNISKKMTINTGNYSSIGPSVSFTIKDVDSEKAKEITELLDDIANIEFTKQILMLTSKMEEIKIKGLKEYVKKHLDDLSDMESEIELSWEKIGKK